MKNILAVDDDKDILYTLEAISEAAGFNIVTISNGENLLESINIDNFSLLIIDYYMPKINGLELVKKIREKHTDIPILVLTVDESVELAKKFFKSGATDFANKPIKAADLISRIKLHLELAETQETRKKDIRDIELPKGVSKKTLDLIYKYLENNPGYQTIEEISQATGLAYQTVHRYLVCMEKKNFVDVELKYGEVGRPIHCYKIKKNE
ncbi:MAG: response regulator [Candidatus Woesearchaeota archaeon]